VLSAVVRDAGLPGHWPSPVLVSRRGFVARPPVSAGGARRRRVRPVPPAAREHRESLAFFFAGAALVLGRRRTVLRGQRPPVVHDTARTVCIVELPIVQQREDFAFCRMLHARAPVLVRQVVVANRQREVACAAEGGAELVRFCSSFVRAFEATHAVLFIVSMFAQVDFDGERAALIGLLAHILTELVETSPGSVATTGRIVLHRKVGKR
jgi:hypothetical protein